MAFYTQLGFTNNTLFSDSQQKCMVWSEQIYVMLIEQDTFKSYSKKKISTTKNTNAYFTLPVESLEKVNDIVDKGLKAGGKETRPMIDEVYMQIRRIEDFDGHIWDIIFIDVIQFKKEKK